MNDFDDLLEDGSDLLEEINSTDEELREEYRWNDRYIISVIQRIQSEGASLVDLTMLADFYRQRTFYQKMLMNVHEQRRKFYFAELTAFIESVDNSIEQVAPNGQQMPEILGTQSLFE